jgi:hypothetical protein
MMIEKLLLIEKGMIMKKDTLLSAVALIIMLFALRSLVAEDYATNCQECCKKGRFVTTECSEHCNQCDIYDDEGAAESRDFPE